MGWMDLDDILSVQTLHFQFLTRPAATPDLLPFQPRRPAAYDLTRQ